MSAGPSPGFPLTGRELPLFKPLLLDVLPPLLDELYPSDELAGFPFDSEELFGENLELLNGEGSRRYTVGGMWSSLVLIFLPMSGPFDLITLALYIKKQINFLTTGHSEIMSTILFS